MIKYCKDLLATLNKIEEHLAKIAGCVRVDHHGHGDKQSISTKHWND